MDKDTFLSKITEIGTCENQDDRLSLLTELSDGISKMYDDNATNETNYKNTIDTLNNSLSETKEKLIKSQEKNMEYFLRINSQKTSEQIKEGTTGIKNPDDHKRSFEDLFKDEEGGN